MGGLSIVHRISNTNPKQPRNFLLNLIETIRSIPSSVLRTLYGLIPKSLHVTVLRIVLKLPGLHENSPELADQVARYVAREQGKFVPSLPQTSGRLAAAVGIRTSSIRVSGSFSDGLVLSPPQHINPHCLAHETSESATQTESQSPPNAEPQNHQLALVPVEDTPTSRNSLLSTVGLSLPSDPFRWGVVGTIRNGNISTTLPLTQHPFSSLEVTPVLPVLHESPAPSYLEALSRDSLVPINNEAYTHTNEDPPRYGKAYRGADERLCTDNELGLFNETGQHDTDPQRLPSPASPIGPPRRRPTPLHLNLDRPVKANNILEGHSLDIQPESPKSLTTDTSEAISCCGIKCTISPPSQGLSAESHYTLDTVPPSPRSPIHESIPRVLRGHIKDDDVEYYIQSIVGEGGFGRVFAAKTPDDKWFAVKVLCKYKQFKIFGGAIEMMSEKLIMMLADIGGMPFINKLCASWSDRFHTYLVMVCPKTIVIVILLSPLVFIALTREESCIIHSRAS